MQKEIYNGLAIELFERTVFDKYLNSLEFKQKLGREDLKIERESMTRGVMYVLGPLGVGVNYHINGELKVELYCSHKKEENLSKVEQIILEKAKEVSEKRK